VFIFAVLVYHSYPNFARALQHLLHKFFKESFSFLRTFIIAAYQYSIFSDYFYIIPRDNDIILPAEQTKASWPPINNNAQYTCRASVNLNIINTSQSAPVLDVDYVAVTQISHSAMHNNTSPFLSIVYAETRLTYENI